nr:hypothetical protein [Enterovibrio nigricans]
MLTGSSIATKDKASSSHIMWLDQDWLHTVIDSVPAFLPSAIYFSEPIKG